MTNVPGPPGPYEPPYAAPPYGATPYGRGPAPTSSTSTVVTALLAVAFVLATALAAWGVHNQDSASAASAGPARQSTGSLPGVPAAAGSSSYPGLATPSIPTPSLPTPTLTPYVPPTPTPTHQPLDPEAINRTFQVYMNALLYRSLSQLKSATCPKLRHTETGTALDHKYINRWKGLPYTIYNSLDYVTIAATVRYVNPNTGGNGGSHTYRWYVDRYPDGHYWVCGILA
jgi:hypothetical protein